jgi:tetratricopeptide (TPR) repeat protein
MGASKEAPIFFPFATQGGSVIWSEGRDGWVVALFALIVALPAALNGFTLDAAVDITHNRFVSQPGALAELLTSDYAAGSNLPSGYWRPVTGLCYWILWRLGHGGAVVFYLFNALVYAVCALCVYRLALIWGAGRFPAVLVGLLFAAHPIHTDVTSGVVGLKDLVASASFLGALTLALLGRDHRHQWRWRHTVWVVPLVFLAGLLAKESGLTLPVVLAVLDWIAGRWDDGKQRRSLSLQYLLLGVALAVKFGAQSYLLSGGFEKITIEPTDNPLVLLSATEGRTMALGLIPTALRLLVWPTRLSPDYSHDVMGLPEQVVSLRAGLGLALLLSAIVIWIQAVRRKQLLSVGGMLILVLSYLPVANLVVLIGSIFAERFLFLPSAGVCLSLAPLLSRATTRSKAAAVVLVGVIALGALTTIRRHRDWVSTERLWLATVEAHPHGLKVSHAAVIELIRTARYREAIAIVDRVLASSLGPSWASSIQREWQPLFLQQRSVARLELGEVELAIEDARQAIIARAARADWCDALDRSLIGLGDPARAALVWLQIADASDDPALESRARTRAAAAYARQADEYRAGGELGRAAESLTRAAELVPADEQLVRNLAVVLSEIGSWDAAERRWRSLLTRPDPNPLDQLNYALMLRQAGQQRRSVEQAALLLARLPEEHPLRREAEQLAGDPHQP